MSLRANIPAPPRGGPVAEAEVALRWEDVTQDGRVRPESLAVALDAVVWDRLLLRHPAWPELRADGVMPLLTRRVVVGGDEVVGVATVSAQGWWQLARVLDDDGELERIVLLTWCEARGRSGEAGRVFAEYTLTRPQAPKPQRAVRELHASGLPRVPEERYAVEAPALLVGLPRGVEALDAHAVTEPQPVVLGVDDTDLNQHVNSLVYLRIFREAALRRLRAHGVTAPLALRWAEIAHRRPCFAAEVAQLELRAFRSGDDLGMLAALGPEDPAARRSCYARMLFEERSG